MRLRFLGKHSSPGNSPTLWGTDAGPYVIQGYQLDARHFGQGPGMKAGDHSASDDGKTKHGFLLGEW